MSVKRSNLFNNLNSNKPMLDKDVMMKLLHEIDDAVGSLNVKLNLDIYGGAVMCAVHNSRQFTEDVGACYRNFDIVEPLIKSLADKYNLPNDWLNNNVEDIKSSLITEDMISMEGFKNISIRYPSAEQMLALKLYASRLSPKSDLRDAVYLAKELSVTSFSQLDNILRKFIYSDALSSRQENFIKIVERELNK